MVPLCSYPLHWPCRQRRLADCNWMSASYTSGPPSLPRRHPTCWASSQWSYTFSSTPCDEAWTFAPLSAHPSTGARAWRLKSRHLCSPHTNPWVILTTTYVQRSGRITNGRRSVRTTLRNSALFSPTLEPTVPEWPFKEQRGSGPTVPCLHKWGMAYSVGVAQMIRPSTTLSSNYPPIELLMDCTAWLFWVFNITYLFWRASMTMQGANFPTSVYTCHFGFKFLSTIQWRSHRKILGGAKYVTLSEQQYLVWDTASRSTKRQDRLAILGPWLLCPSWLRLCWNLLLFIQKTCSWYGRTI